MITGVSLHLLYLIFDRLLGGRHCAARIVVQGHRAPRDIVPRLLPATARSPIPDRHLRRAGVRTNAFRRGSHKVVAGGDDVHLALASDPATAWAQFRRGVATSGDGASPSRPRHLTRETAHQAVDAMAPPSTPPKPGQPIDRAFAQQRTTQCPRPTTSSSMRSPARQTSGETDVVQLESWSRFLIVGEQADRLGRM
jgi:hypothetical protein